MNNATKSEIFHRSLLMCAVQLGARPCHAMTYQYCRLTRTGMWLPFNKRTFTNKGEYTAVTNSVAIPATFITIHPCHMTSMIWMMTELHAMIDSVMKGITSLSAADMKTEEVGDVLFRWLSSDYIPDTTMLMRLAAFRTMDYDFRIPLITIRRHLWELFDAKRVAVEAMASTKELYIQIVDDAPWIAAHNKQSTLDRE